MQGLFSLSRYFAKTWGIDPEAKTPAFELEDGVDYVPADTNDVFGNAIQLVFAVLLLILGVVVAIEGLKKLVGKETENVASTGGNVLA